MGTMREFLHTKHLEAPNLMHVVHSPQGSGVVPRQQCVRYGIKCATEMEVELLTATTRYTQTAQALFLLSCPILASVPLHVPTSTCLRAAMQPPLRFDEHDMMTQTCTQDNHNKPANNPHNQAQQ